MFGLSFGAGAAAWFYLFGQAWFTEDLEKLRREMAYTAWAGGIIFGTLSAFVSRAKFSWLSPLLFSLPFLLFGQFGILAVLHDDVYSRNWSLLGYTSFLFGSIGLTTGLAVKYGIRKIANQTEHSTK